MIKSFTGQHAFLSNFSPCSIEYEGTIFPSTEHLFQSLKILDPNLRLRISRILTPGQAKKFSRTIELRPNWNKIRVSIMRDVVYQKFQQNLVIRKMLLDTGDKELVEGNDWHDKFWGVDNQTNEGDNHLGNILMEIRDDLRGEL